MGYLQFLTVMSHDRDLFFGHRLRFGERYKLLEDFVGMLVAAIKLLNRAIGMMEYYLCGTLGQVLLGFGGYSGEYEVYVVVVELEGRKILSPKPTKSKSRCKDVFLDEQEFDFGVLWIEFVSRLRCAGDLV